MYSKAESNQLCYLCPAEYIWGMYMHAYLRKIQDTVWNFPGIVYNVYLKLGNTFLTWYSLTNERTSMPIPTWESGVTPNLGVWEADSQYKYSPHMPRSSAIYFLH